MDFSEASDVRDKEIKRLNLLEIMPVRFPSVVPQAVQLDLPPTGKAFAFGAASALRDPSA